MNSVHRSKVINQAVPRSAVVTQILLNAGIDEYDSIDAVAFLIMGITFAKSNGISKEEIMSMFEQLLWK